MDEFTQEIAKEAVKQTLGQAYEDILQPPARAAGKALGTLMNVFNLMIAPLERAHIRSEANTEKLRKYLECGFEAIPPDQRVEPPLEIVGPALEALKWTEDETVQKMFMDLLLSAMDSATQPQTHKAFIQIITEIAPLEARMLREIAQSEMGLLVEFPSLIDEDFPDWPGSIVTRLPFSKCSPTIFQKSLGKRRCDIRPWDFHELYPYERGIDNLLRLQLIEVNPFVDTYLEMSYRLNPKQEHTKAIALAKEFRLGRDLAGYFICLADRYKNDKNKLRRYLDYSSPSRISLTRFGEAFVQVCKLRPQETPMRV